MVIMRPKSSVPETSDESASTFLHRRERGNVLQHSMANHVDADNTMLHLCLLHVSLLLTIDAFASSAKLIFGRGLW